MQRQKRKKILFICTGNTCRSPMAEALLRREIKRRKIKYVDVASAGLKTQKDASLNPLSAQVLAENGLALDKFRPRRLTRKLFENAFVLITMTEAQKQAIGNFEKTYSVAELAGGLEIADPYGRGIEAYRAAFAALSEAAVKIADKIEGK